MNAQFVICIAIFILMILGYMQNKVSKNGCSTDCNGGTGINRMPGSKDSTGWFFHSNTIVMATTFIVSEGLSRTQAVHKVFGALVRIKSAKVLSL
ncbi:MAG: hypothetical protein V8S58_02660 [Lachnospiraceae bacterium]